MGINGLIGFMEKASTQVHIKDFRGKTLALDSYCLLHKGAFACSVELALGVKTCDMHIQYCLKYVNMLLSHEIKPILVFDGRHLPAKEFTEKKRRESRQNSRKRAVELMKLGKTEEARQHFRRCVDITHEMALQLIKECRKRNVDCICAPYEADAQLAYLNKIKIADYIVTEDSDLVLFGCQKVLFKLTLSGSALLIDCEKLHLTMPNCRPEKFSLTKFRTMCILSGCDYLDSLPGIGLAKACKFVVKSEETDLRKLLPKMPAYLNMRQLQVTEEYIEKFLKAEATFLHMFVYDPIQRKVVRLTDPKETNIDIKFCSNAGEFLDDITAFQMALGNLNPFTMKELDNFNPPAIPDKKLMICKYPSIWENGFDASTKLEVKPRMDLSSFVTKPLVNPSSLVLEIGKIEQIDVATNSLEDHDLVMSYSSPPLKKTKLQDFCYSQSTQNKPKVNPFFKKIEFQDTGKDVENLSLIRKASPTKKLITIFRKTDVNENHKVISRFFQPRLSTLNITCDQNNQETLKQLSSKKELEVSEESDNENSKDSDSNNIETKDSSIVDLDLYEEKVVVKNVPSIKPNAPGKCRKVGLAKPKHIPSAAQGKLSSFGFTKKPSLM